MIDFIDALLLPFYFFLDEKKLETQDEMENLEGMGFFAVSCASGVPLDVAFLKREELLFDSVCHSIWPYGLNMISII